jgi:hypothetical protein
MEMFQHDSETMFRFVLRGVLTGDRVQELDHAWTTAKSILGGKELVVDISGITDADAAAIDILSRMRQSGARLTAALPLGSAEFIRRMGIPTPEPAQCARKATLKLLRVLGLAAGRIGDS